MRVVWCLRGDVFGLVSFVVTSDHDEILSRGENVIRPRGRDSFVEVTISGIVATGSYVEGVTCFSWPQV